MQKNKLNYKTQFYIYLFLLFVGLIPIIVPIIIIILFALKIIDIKKLSKIELESLTKKIELENEIQDLEENYAVMEAVMEDLDNLQIDDFIFEYYNDETSDELKNKLEIANLEFKNFIKSDKAVLSTINYTIYDKKRAKEIKKDFKENRKQIIRCFESESNFIFSNLTIKNYDNSIKKIVKSFETLNIIFGIDDIRLNDNALKLKLNQLNILKQILVKKDEEKEAERLRKEQLREEEKVRHEIEKAKEKIEKEEKQFNNEISKMLSYMQKTTNDVEKEIYANKIKELEEKIKLLEKDKENVLQREANTRAGFVYIISNIGSFGEDVFKIGMTRRLEPMDRISELSSASVPFPFDVHALIFSDDAPALENALHKHFQDKSVNKVNLKKEFFKINIDELKEFILKELGQTIQFIDIPKAEQYRESLRIIEEIETCV